MDMIKEEIRKIFGGKLRLRISGICIKEGSILLVKHVSLGSRGYLWAPPGGGLHYEETVQETLKREFLEETGLLVEPKHLMFVNEYFEEPLHALELFFKVEIVGGTLKMGIDPELHPDKQIIKEARFVSFSELPSFASDTLHSLFRTYAKEEDFLVSSHFLQNIVNPS